MDETGKSLKGVGLVESSQDIIPIVPSTDDQNNLAAPLETSTSKKGKKKKKKKLTAKEKQLEKLEKQAEKLVNDHEKFNEFIKFISFWLKSYQKISYKQLNKQSMLNKELIKMKKAVKKDVEDDDEENDDNDDDNDDDNEEDEGDEKSIKTLIPYDEFKLVLEDLNIPCTSTELHLLCKLLDQESTGLVNYKNLTPDYVKKFLNHEFEDGIRFVTSSKMSDKPSSSSYPAFVFKLWKPLLNEMNPKYVMLDIKLATFANDKEFQGHIKNEILFSHLTIFSLIELIKKKADVASSHIAVFKDSSRHKSVKLEESKTLEECGYNGSSYDDPNEYTIFYDYLTTLRSDPIINSDYYFINNTKYVPKK